MFDPGLHRRVARAVAEAWHAEDDGEPALGPERGAGTAGATTGAPVATSLAGNADA